MMASYEAIRTPQAAARQSRTARAAWPRVRHRSKLSSRALSLPPRGRCPAAGSSAAPPAAADPASQPPAPSIEACGGELSGPARPAGSPLRPGPQATQSLLGRRRVPSA